MCNWVKRNYYFLSVLVPKRISPAPLNWHCGIPEKAIPPHPDPLPKEREKPAARRGKNAAPACRSLGRPRVALILSRSAAQAGFSEIDVALDSPECLIIELLVVSDLDDRLAFRVQSF